jgi:hypothetical protein
MKRALLHSLEPGRICDIVEPGNEFEVHANFSWVDVPDDTTSTDSWDPETNTVIKFSPLNDPNFVANGWKVARGIAYGSPADQLDMIFKEIQTTGTVSPTGPWATHVANVKASLPKDDPAAIHAWNQQWITAALANTSSNSSSSGSSSGTP